MRSNNQRLRMIDPDAVNDLSSELCDRMEQIIDHLRLRTVFPDLQIERSVHIHGNGFDGCTSLWPQPAKKGTEGGSVTPFPNPQYLLCIGIRYDCGLMMSFNQGKLIHHRAAQTVPLQLTNLPQQSPAIRTSDSIHTDRVTVYC
nr:hypothetical protein [Trabulsiella odontotermitis]